MSFKVFYAWQSDTPKEFNWRFIGDCIKEAITLLKKTYPDNSPDFIYSRDTKGDPGWPNIPESVYDKIAECDVFIGDLSVIGIIPTNPPKPQLNSNVVSELSYALAKISEERIINVMNEYYGRPTEPDVIPFDFAQRRFPILYKLSTDNLTDRKTIKKTLINKLFYAIKLIFDTELERQKQEFDPFDTWKTWDDSTEKKFIFESNDYVQVTFDSIRTQVNKPKSSTRILGLSGLGKTRIVLECFRKENGVSADITNRILYVNLNDNDELEILKKCKSFFRNKVIKTIILDNCSIQFHSQIQSLFSNGDCKLNFITLSAEPDENHSEFDPDGETLIISLISNEFKGIVRNLLINNFIELQADEVELLVDYSNGLPLYAELMATNPSRAKYQPGTLNQNGVIERLLGDLFTNDDSKAVIMACSLFSKFGYSKELAYQAQAIADTFDLCNLTLPNTNPADIPELKQTRFKEICDRLYRRQLLEKIGRTYSIRPSPLGIRMAEEWWRNCTASKFERIIPILEKANLIENFCEQFRNLKHIENAKIIVGKLCQGVFSSAEVLNTIVGSRLFRSFVFVNPLACKNALVSAFSNYSKPQLESIIDGRRELVWALEALCFRDETFDDATKILAAFAISEVENFANNATGQFLHLFKLYLPGTSVNLERRLNIIKYCLNKDDDYINLGIKALGVCLTMGTFTRMVGAENQGDRELLMDYNPSGEEVYNYWDIAIKKLENIALSDNQFSNIAANNLLVNFYSLCVHNAGKLIIPSIELLMTRGLINKMELRKKIQFILSTKRIYDQKAINELQRIFDSLSPTTFLEKFNLYVQSPAHNEYLSDDGKSDQEKTNNLYKIIEELAYEFLYSESDLNFSLKYLVTGNIQEGINFGFGLSKALLNDAKRKEFIYKLIDELVATDSQNRNASVVIGILTAIKGDSIKSEIFKTILQNKNLNDLIFIVSRSVAFSFENITELLIETANGNYHTSQFSIFTYGWGLKHLSLENIISIINFLRTIDDDGKAVAFSISGRWYSDISEMPVQFKVLVRSQVLKDSSSILNINIASIHFIGWANIVVQFLNETNDIELARGSLDLIFEESNHFEGFLNKENHFLTILDVLQEKYFNILWEKITNIHKDIDKYSITFFHFRNLLGYKNDSFSLNEGILFKNNPEKFRIIFDWCKIHRQEKIQWIAVLLPAYDLKETNKWHPYARKFIDEFGENTDILNCIEAKMNTFSWTGSPIGKYEDDKQLFNSLLDHPIETVRRWAEYNYTKLESRLEREINREKDGEFGY
ncbi:MAG: hypothetical protein V9E90_03580 [Saprospiraceae bacterium]